MAKLWGVTKLVRSKNAGAFVATFETMFDEAAVYEQVRDSGVLNKKLVAEMYQQNEEDVLFFNCDNAPAIKFSFPRPVASGDLADSDCFGGQQYTPLLEIDVSVSAAQGSDQGPSRFGDEEVERSHSGCVMGGGTPSAPCLRRGRLRQLPLQGGAGESS